MQKVYIAWFRQDLRICDNPALKSACAAKVLPIYIFDDHAPGPFKIGSVSKVWLHYSLTSLNQSLKNKLNLYIGKSEEVIESLTKKYDVQGIFWNQCYEPWNLEADAKIKELCNQKSIKYQIFNANYLWHPEQILKDDKNYYKVFTAYKKKSLLFSPRKAVSAPKFIDCELDAKNQTKLEDLNLIPNHQWFCKIKKLWNIGEVAAHAKLNAFVKKDLTGYKKDRDYPAKKQTSKLSPHLHFGEISPAQILESLKNISIQNQDTEHFLSEVIWREFSCYLLYHFKFLHIKNFNSKFDKFKWNENQEFLKAWQQGKTGYPLVDAGMRQLWQTGFMHNRVRMVVASFLVKNLNIHWHQGQNWFWDCLVDADLANNSASWQWVAGCGADAAPYFRIFNPTTQGQKFDLDGNYTKRFVPELKDLPNKYLFTPWNAPSAVLRSANVTLGQTYPMPIVDLVISRNNALQMYKNL